MPVLVDAHPDLRTFETKNKCIRSDGHIELKNLVDKEQYDSDAQFDDAVLLLKETLANKISSNGMALAYAGGVITLLLVSIIVYLTNITNNMPHNTYMMQSMKILHNYVYK